MTNKYLQSIKEYSSSFFVALLVSIILSDRWLFSIQNFFIEQLSNIPITIYSLLLINLGTMLLIILLGILKIEFISFFLVINGFALGILFMLYRENLVFFVDLLFPHSLFEMVLIIVFCSQVKEISQAYTLKKSIQVITILWIRLLCSCVPLWLISGFLESFSMI